MRYVIEFLIPAMIVIVVALVLFRNRPDDGAARANAAPQTKDDSATLSTGTFILILIIGAAFTVAVIYALHNGNS